MSELSSPWIWILVVGLVALLLGLWFAQWWARFRSRWRMRRLRRMGKRGERGAQRLLRKAGYRVTCWQVSVATTVRCDGVDIAIRVQADAMVIKNGVEYVAEIKGGAEAAKLTNRTTRRQLLEYSVAFGCSGVVLVDAHNGAVHLVEFPGLNGH